MLSAFIPPAIARGGPPPQYPSLGFEFGKRDIVYVCPFEMDLVHDVSIFDPPSNVRISPNGRVKCQIDSQQTIRVSAEPKDNWYYTSACDGGWIHKSQVKIIR